MAIPFIIEDGSGVDGANSYLSVADSDDLAALYGVAWEATDQEIHLVRASLYIDNQFTPSGSGKVSSTQGLKFPQLEVYCEGIPQDGESQISMIELPCLMLASQSQQGVDLLNLTPDDPNAKSLIEEVIEVGPIEIKEKFAIGSKKSESDPSGSNFDNIRSMLGCLISAGTIDQIEVYRS